MKKVLIILAVAALVVLIIYLIMRPKKSKYEKIVETFPEKEVIVVVEEKKPEIKPVPESLKIIATKLGSGKTTARFVAGNRRM